MKTVFDSLTQGLAGTPQASPRTQALALMALLAGGVMISRTVIVPGLSQEIGEAVQKFAEMISSSRSI